MDITSKTVTHRVHTAVATVDTLKGVAVAAVIKQLNLPEGAIASTDAELGADGAITVEVVEIVPDAPKLDAPSAPQTGAQQPVI